MKIICIILGILYGVNPYDILPDFMPGLGWVDDIILLVVIYWYYISRGRTMGKDSRFEAGKSAGKTADTGEESTEDRATASSRVKQTPHEILGISPGAGHDEIRKAYREKANKYHPDKVSHLGPEFRELAEIRFKEIQEAYNTLKAKR